MRSTRWLIIAAPVVVALSCIAALVSIWARWPHQFGGHGDPDHMLADFVSSGTALAPPLFILVVFAVAALQVRRTDLWGSVACVVIIALSALMIVASLGEAMAGHTPDVPRAVQVISGASGTVAGALLALLSLGSLRQRHLARREDVRH